MYTCIFTCYVYMKQQWIIFITVYIKFIANCDSCIESCVNVRYIKTFTDFPLLSVYLVFTVVLL